MDEQGETETPLGRYHWWFTGAMVALIGHCCMVLNMSFHSSVSSGLTPDHAIHCRGRWHLIGLLASERRAPSEDERKRLTFGNLGIFLLFNALLLLGLVSSGGLQVMLAELDVPFSTFMIIFMSILTAAMVLNYLLIRWAYGGLSHKRADRLKE